MYSIGQEQVSSSTVVTVVLTMIGWVMMINLTRGIYKHQHQHTIHNFWDNGA